jgi:hypothetical protein
MISYPNPLAPSLNIPKNQKRLLQYAWIRHGSQKQRTFYLFLFSLTLNPSIKEEGEGEGEGEGDYFWLRLD